MKLINSEINIKVNKSSFYVLPVLDKFINLEFLDLMQNSYIYNNDKERVFSILYKFSGTKKFLKFEEKLMQSKLYIGHEDYDEYVLYKFKLPIRANTALELLQKERVNFNSEESKLDIRNFTKRRGFANVTLFDKYLDGRVMVSKPDMQKETFSNNVREHKSFLNANDLYKKRKKNE